MKRLAKLLCLLLVSALLLAGCNSGGFTKPGGVSSGDNNSRDFVNAGIRMRLPATFVDFTETETNDGEYEFLYASDVHGVLALREDKASLIDSMGQMDAQAYGDLIAELYEIDAKTENVDGFYTYTYEAENEEDGTKLTFTCLFMETEEDFWNIQISCPSDRYEADKDNIWQWLTSTLYVGDETAD